jgi:hypothetical protein
MHVNDYFSIYEKKVWLKLFNFQKYQKLERFILIKTKFIHLKYIFLLFFRRWNYQNQHLSDYLKEIYSKIIIMLIYLKMYGLNLLWYQVTNLDEYCKIDNISCICQRIILFYWKQRYYHNLLFNWRFF